MKSKKQSKTHKKNKAFRKQVGGNHYEKLKNQPTEYILANDMGFVEGNIVKYISRWRDKNGIEDLKKIIHYCEILIEYEKKNGKEKE